MHCLQQCKSALHFGQTPLKSTPAGSVVEQLKQRDAATCCTKRGNRGPVTSIGGRGPWGLGRSSRNGLESRSESMYPFCLYLRSLSMGKSCSVVSWTLCIENKDPWRRSSKDRRNRNAFMEVTAGHDWRWDHSEACGESEAHRLQVREPATASNYLFTTEFTGLHALSCEDWFGQY